MATAMSIVMSLTLLFVILNGSKRTLRSVYIPYGPKMCEELCKISADTFVFVKEDLSCHRIPAECKSSNNDMISCPKNSIDMARDVSDEVLDDKRGDYLHFADGNTHLTLKLYKDEKPREEALKICQAEGASLVKPDSKKKVRLIIRAFYKEHEKHFVYIGLRDKYDNDTWYWDDGTKLKHYRNWGYGEPHNINVVKENCAAIVFRAVGNGRWIDLSCQRAFRFICEK